MNLTLARTLLKLWTLRLWVGLGVLVAGVAAVAMFAMSHSTVYSIASTQMLVDSPDSALANSNTLLAGYVARAGVFARLMTSDEALHYIGKAAGINGNLIEATGPIEINGSPTATHAPVRDRKRTGSPGLEDVQAHVRAEPFSAHCGGVRVRSHDRASGRVGQRRRDGLRELRQSTERGQRFSGQPHRDPSTRPGDWRGRRSSGEQEHRAPRLRGGIRDLVLVGVVRKPSEGKPARRQAGPGWRAAPPCWSRPSARSILVPSPAIPPCPRIPSTAITRRPRR